VPSLTKAPPAPKPESPLWSTSANDVWAWTQREPPSIWCEASGLVIPRNAMNAEPGPVNLTRTPYFREPIDLVFQPHIRQLWWYKSVQIGFTRYLTNLMCYILAHPDLAYAIGVLFPDEDTVEEYFGEELQPTIDQSDCMRKLKTGRAWDETKGEIWLQSGPIFGLYAGSVSRLARRSLRYVMGDEINKYRPFKVEASPITLLLERTTVHLHHARAIFGSTPTDQFGNITQGFNNCLDKRRYFMPCARCGFYQPWMWGQVKGFADAPGEDKLARAEWVRQNTPCVYECINCRKHTLDSEKASCVAAGVWVSGTGPDLERWQAVHEVGESGKLSAPHPTVADVALHIWAIVSPWLTMTDLAVRFIKAEGDLDKTRAFRNSTQALPFDDEVKNVRPSIVRDKKKIAPPPATKEAGGKVPKWAHAIYATADVQKDWGVLCIRAWGWGFKSQLLYYGTWESFDELFERSLESVFPTEDGGVAAAKALLIDSGGEVNRTAEVYDFSQRDTRILPTKGTDGRMRKLWHDSEPRPGVLLRTFDSQHFKDCLWRALYHQDPTHWMPHNEVSEQYCMEMASEHLVRERGKTFWKLKGTTRNEAWDAEVLQRAAAEMDGIGAAPAPVAETPKTSLDPTPYTNPLTSHKGKW
jgi:phage terminase large subunit GpA-like protein